MTNERSAIVTGGTRGIGLGIARALAHEGWRLALCGRRSEDAVRGTLDELRTSGADVLYREADVSRIADHEAFVSEVNARFGGVNALVNNAGRGPRVRADLLEASQESFDEIVRTNLEGPYFLAQRIARQLVDLKRKNRDAFSAIVFVTSVSATMASINRGEYCVSKAGLAMAAQLFAVRLAEHGIPVYDVRPGIIATDMTEPVRELYDRRIAEGLVPQRRWGTPDDVGSVVAALLRGDAPYATGSVIRVDGGLSIPCL
jgi:3-oxoacyl-[acyl-carrier protein] reductase